MARTYRVSKARIRSRVKGRLTVPDIDRGTRRAQLENAETLRNATRARAQSLIKGRNKRLGVEDRSRGQSMVSLYTTRVRNDNTLSFYNRSPRALWFEEGVRAHAIIARNGFFLKFPNSDPWGSAARLPEFGPFVYARSVWHPGQEGHHVMRDTLRDHTPGFERNIIRHVAREVTRGG